MSLIVNHLNAEMGATWCQSRHSLPYLPVVANHGPGHDASNPALGGKRSGTPADLRDPPRAV
jgi:hypothetical protein